jgi:hypothetical protein
MTTWRPTSNSATPRIPDALRTWFHAVHAVTYSCHPRSAQSEPIWPVLPECGDILRDTAHPQEWSSRLL